MTASPERFIVAVMSSYAQGRDWIVTAMQDDFQTTGTIAATVICSSAPHHQIFGDRVALGTNQTALLHQRCPLGEVPTGGGGRGSDVGVLVQSSLPNLDAWEIGYWNATAAPRTVEPFVICSAEPHHVVPGRPGSVTKFHGTGTSQVQCPAGQQVTGGGGYSEGTELILSTFENNGWRASSANASSDTREVTAMVVCTGSQ
ncbi:hypothetical protein ACIGQE_20975 [Streptomyces sp. NPDC053429]|uniref:hypothetical protein n=1 Tax=Streptomyces sp. NPDC053429 TaxID=3365702 RepID=UPI0037D2A470